MRARVKATGEIVDVVFESSYVKDGVKVSLWTDGKKEYSKDSLDFIDTDMPSEKRMRYELLKISIQGILSCDKIMGGIYITSKENGTSAESIIVKTSLGLVDEAMKQLKEREETK